MESSIDSAYLKEMATIMEKDTTQSYESLLSQQCIGSEEQYLERILKL
jgi:hypothetical protein